MDEGCVRLTASSCIFGQWLTYLRSQSLFSFSIALHVRYLLGKFFVVMPHVDEQKVFFAIGLATIFARAHIQVIMHLHF